VTPPTVSCPEGPNPAGHVPSSHNPDGFYRMVAGDNASVSLRVSAREPTGSPVST